MDENKKTVLDELLVKYKVEPVGCGYIDCIILKENVENFVRELTALGIEITAVSWWCHCTDENKGKYGCPHGLGGPVSVYHDGWFSETCELYSTDFSNDKIMSYIFDEFPAHEHYLPCMVPALCLDVPDDWKNNSK